MTFCRQGHTLIDNEAEAQWDQLVPGTFFDLIVSATTFFGIVDEYTPPTPTTLVCRLYSDPARTILVTAPITTGVQYDIENFVDYNWTPRDVELVTSKLMGTWTSPPVVVRDASGFWTGSWTATPMTDETMQFNFDGTYQLFPATADQPLGAAISGVGLAAGDYIYCIVPVDGSGRLGAGSVRVDVTLGAPGDIQLDWLPNNQVTSWNIYGRTAAGFGLITNLPGGTVVFVDDGTLAPNTGLQPPLFSDPAWTIAVPNKAVNIIDGTATLTGDTNELGIEKRDDGIVLSDAEGIGTLDLINGPNTFDLTEVESTANTVIGAVIDPNIFTNETGPVEALPPRIDTYDQHIFIDSDGFKRIVSIDSTTDRTTTIILNTTTGIVTSIIEETSTQTELGRGDMTLEQFLLDSPGGVAPDVGSASTKITYENFVTQSDGVITGDQTIELNTYQVAVGAGGTGVASLLIHNADFAPPDIEEIHISNDAGATYFEQFKLEDRITPFPGSFFHGSLSTGYGEGWLIISLRQVSGGSNFGFAWTNDVTLGTFPFQDGSGRNGAGDSQDFDTWLFGWDFAYRGANVTMANGKVVHYHAPYAHNSFSSDAEHIQFFFPASGVFYSGTEPGLGFDDLFTQILWPEKNLFIYVMDNSELYTMDFGTNESAPVTNKQKRADIDSSPNGIGFHVSPSKVILTYRNTPNYMYSESTDGINWSVDNVLPGGINDPTFRMLGQHESWNPAINKWMSTDAAGNIVTSPTGIDNWTIEVSISALTDADYVGQGLDSAEVPPAQVPGQPLLTDGNKIIFVGPDDAIANKYDSITRMDLDFTNPQATNVPPVLTVGMEYFRDRSDIRATIAAQPGVPEDTIFANIRPYIPQRPAFMPLDASPDMPAPFRTRDTSKSAVYDSSRTYDKRTPDGFTMNITVTTFARGGTGSTTATRVENGVFSTENIIYERTPNLPPKTQSYIPFGFPTPKPFG